MGPLVSLLILATAGAFAQVVEGTVLNSVTGNGIAGVKVELQGSGKTAYTLTTDATGHFRAEDVPDGSYTVRYSAREYWSSDARYPLPSVGIGTYPTFPMSAGASPVKLELHMAPYAKVSGRVLDDRANGVANAPVEMSGAGFAMVRTDAQGKFEIQSGLLPGEYTLSVEPPAGLKPPVRPPGDERARVWAATSYPSKIVLLPSAERNGIEIKLEAVPAYPVRGLLLGPDGKPAPNVEVRMQAGLTYEPSASSRSKADGTFELPAVRDGEWLVLAETAGLKANTHILIAGKAVEKVQLHLSPPFTIRGKVVIEPPDGAPAPTMPSVLLAPHPGPIYDGRGGMFISGPNEHPDTDGNFVLKDVYPDRYGVYSWGNMAPDYLDAIRVGDTEITASEMEFSGALPITVIYKRDGGWITGTVERCDGGHVILVPQDPGRQLPQYFRLTECTTGDHYEFQAVRPADYYLVAAPRAMRIDLSKLDYGLLNQAGRVTVRPGEACSADLKLAVAQ
jgi:Carboxypeptidase regulatory-like domain